MATKSGGGRMTAATKRAARRARWQRPGPESPCRPQDHEPLKSRAMTTVSRAVEGRSFFRSANGDRTRLAAPRERLRLLGSARPRAPISRPWNTR